MGGHLVKMFKLSCISIMTELYLAIADKLHGRHAPILFRQIRLGTLSLVG